MIDILDARNPVQARAIGRALAWREVCELVSQPIVLGNEAREFPVFYNHATKDYRAVVSYPVPAINGRKYLADWAGDGLQMKPEELIPLELSDNDMHLLHVTYVSRWSPEGLTVLSLSKRHSTHAYRRFHQDQLDLGIWPGNPLYIHPLDSYSKDVCLLKLLQGMTYTDDSAEIISAMLQDEDLIRAGLEGQFSEWYNTVREIA